MMEAGGGGGGQVMWSGCVSLRNCMLYLYSVQYTVYMFESALIKKKNKFSSYI
jgi:hypothetical protein